MFATKDGPDFCRSQRDRNRKLAPDRAHLLASSLGPVECQHQHYRLSRTHCATHLVEPSDRYPGPTGETHHLTTTLCQKGLDAIREPWRCRYRLARGSREKPPLDRSLKYISARPEPQTPARQAGSHIGTELTAGADDKAQ
jgi:hypothetical protein